VDSAAKTAPSPRHLPTGLGIALLLCSAAAAGADAPPDAPADAVAESPAPVPGIPFATDIETLEPIPLRRALSRAEGRISDIGKNRAAELNGLEAAVGLAEARTAAATETAEPSADTATAPDSRSDPRLDPAERAERRRAILSRYAGELAEARAELKALLKQQARIDPDAPDQQRLPEAATAGR
jgi:hypothetical protein